MTTTINLDDVDEIDREQLRKLTQHDGFAGWAARILLEKDESATAPPEAPA